MAVVLSVSLISTGAKSQVRNEMFHKDPIVGSLTHLSR